MAATYKVLGQVNPSAITATSLYTVPAATQTVCSTLVIANISSIAGSFRVAVRPAGAALENKHYISYDTAIAGNDSIFLTLGISLSATDVITVYASSANLCFNLYGSEIA